MNVQPQSMHAIFTRMPVPAQTILYNSTPGGPRPIRQDHRMAATLQPPPNIRKQRLSRNLTGISNRQSVQLQTIAEQGESNFHSQNNSTTKKGTSVRSVANMNDNSAVVLSPMAKTTVHQVAKPLTFQVYSAYNGQLEYSASVQTYKEEKMSNLSGMSKTLLGESARTVDNQQQKVGKISVKEVIAANQAEYAEAPPRQRTRTQKIFNPKRGSFELPTNSFCFCCEQQNFTSGEWPPAPPQLLK